MSDNITSLEKYIVVATDENDVRTYLAFDHSSGGYPYWSSDIRGIAQLTMEEAMHEVDELERKALPENHTNYTDGVVRPHSDISTMLDLSDKKPKGKAVVTIERLLSLQIRRAEISGEIKRPKGFLY